MADTDESRQLIHRAAEAAGYKIEPWDGAELRLHAPRSIRRRRRPARLLGAASAAGRHTQVQWTSEDAGPEIHALLLEAEEHLPEGVMYYHGFTDAAARAGLAFGDKHAIRRTINLLDPADVVYAVGKGHLNDEPGILVLTGTRLMFVPDGIDASATVTNVLQSSIDSILLGKRSSGETLKVTLDGRVLEISRLGHGEGHGIAKTFREIALERDRTKSLSADGGAEVSPDVRART
jgi:hypothetical protein